jgi:hypothetical protein
MVKSRPLHPVARATVALARAVICRFRRRRYRVDRNRAASGSGAGRDIARAIADGPRPLQVQRQIGGSAQDQAGKRFAAIARDRVLRQRGIGQVRTTIRSGDGDALCGEQLGEALVDGVCLALGEETARDARLIGDDHQDKACAGEHPRTLGRIGDEFDIFRRAHVFTIHIQGAVAV